MTRQRTVKDPVKIEGVGLQTGKRVTLNIKSSPANSGVNFVRLDLPNKPLLNIQSIDFNNVFNPTENRTTLRLGPLKIRMTEHILSALSGLSIDNALLELDNEELPGLDGSAAGFVEAIKKAGVVEQDAPKKVLKIEKPIRCEDSRGSLEVFPDEDFKISYTISYDSPAIGEQSFSMVVNEKSFEEDIAPARTFCLASDAIKLFIKGFGRAAKNTLILRRNGKPFGKTLRFSNEPVRHKILDLIGDLYLLGMPLEGRVVAIKSGHALNMELVKKLKSYKP